MSYEFLDHTADLKIRASGDSFEQALSEAAKGLFAAIAGDSKITPDVTKEFTVKMHKPEVLVHGFLTELLFTFATKHIIFSEFDMTLKEAMGYKLTVKAKGQVYDPKKHRLVKEVKAVTYHDMKVGEEEGVWVIEVVCDT